MAGRLEKGVDLKGLRIEKGVHEVLEDVGVRLGGLDGVVWRCVPFLEERE